VPETCKMVVTHPYGEPLVLGDVGLTLYDTIRALDHFQAGVYIPILGRLAIALSALEWTYGKLLYNSCADSKAKSRLRQFRPVGYGLRGTG
jgi:hypothetical protein